jgi:hypothetical protein
MMMRYACLGAAVLFTAVGCAGGEKAADSAAAAPTGDRAQTAAAVSNAIAANPSAADSILRAAGHTRDSFEKLMYEIAGDSAMSVAYTAAKTP